MPVIRGYPTAEVLSPDRRIELLEQLKQELAGQRTPDGPVIFEIPLEQSTKMDVVVVWKAFESLASEDRSSLILDAYGDKQARIALPLGVTFEEALEQHVLPYTVTPLAREGEASFDDLRHAMIEEGGFTRANGKVELRFPSMAMAEAAHRRLCDKMPKGYWSIVQNPVPAT